MELSRNKSHDFAFQTMYSFLILENCNVAIDFKGILELIYEQDYENIDIFSKELLIEGLKHQNTIIEYVSKFLNKWKFDRLNFCAQAILINSVCEFFYLKDADKAVIINVAIKLAKKYTDQRDYKFINAVLDNCLVENGNFGK